LVSPQRGALSLSTEYSGGHHDWVEGRRGRCCRITLIDDAAKTRLSRFFEEETMFGAMTVLKMSRFGRACDRPGIEVIPANSPQAKRIQGSGIKSWELAKR
jgi:hypothetical protein